MVALLFVGGAISLMSCEDTLKTTDLDDEKIVSRTVRDMESLQSENGVKKQLMRASLREEYEYAKPAYEEYTRGIEAIGFDSLGMPASSVVADYALHWTERDLWELNGNVVVEGEDGQKLYTQQLRWDRKIKKIYSNVDCKVEQDGDVLYGVGFEAADDFSRWTFLGVTGTVHVAAAEPTADSTAATPPLHEESPETRVDSLTAER
ncbi:MAG: LPS export ABC transporter periplasmic protein LptC [Alistipes sp.]|jgi:LPS export ABC transporter protein LptC|nr:LPS export ABC transporter periplasmic protein LptC [Alistipes sp.]